MNSDIVTLANEINDYGGMFLSELITCYKTENGMIVLEGNRRITSCKVLLDRTLIPNNFENQIDFINPETKKNIQETLVSVFPNRDSAQIYLRNRHVEGPKQWAPYEKNSFYAQLFTKHGDIEKVIELTKAKTIEVRESLEKYFFFKKVVRTLITKHDLVEIEKMKYLPMVDRFMYLLVGDDPDVGLDLYEDSMYQFQPASGKEVIYDQILILVGEAFLIRGRASSQVPAQDGKILSSEVSGRLRQINLIKENKRIPGLYELIKKYKGQNYSTIQTAEPNTDESIFTTAVSNFLEELDDLHEITDDSELLGERFIPKKERKELEFNPGFVYFSFNRLEIKTWRVFRKPAYLIKITDLIKELATLRLSEYPNSCALIFRNLLDIASQYVLSYHSEYDTKDKNLSLIITDITKLYLFNFSDLQKYTVLKKSIHDLVTNENFINILDTYINSVGGTISPSLIYESWSIMKLYISSCLEYEISN